MTNPISSVDALEILDSCGQPMLQVTVQLNGGGEGVAMVPSGASTGLQRSLSRRFQREPPRTLDEELRALARSKR